MATLTERLESDYKTALKARQTVRVDALRLIKAEMQRVAIEQRKEGLEDQEIIQVLNRQAKRVRETIEFAKQGERQEILARATEELAIINAYLPQPLSDEALQALVEEAIQEAGSNRGQIMKYIMEKAAGRVDGKRASQLVGARLNAQKS